MPDLQPPDLSPPAPRPPVRAGGARPLPGPADALEANRTAMLGSARRVSLCEDDAQDAVQAASERYLKHHARVDPETATGWLVTVARNEALRVRERRVRTGAIDDDDRRLVHTGDGPDDLAVREEDLALAREALGHLKPQERLALWMQAEGRSYDEIAQELSWTRTKVNRSITEGRAHLRRTLAGISTGEGCAAAGPRIDRLASGEASAADLRDLRPHLRRCAGCRGRLRRARGARWGVLPPVLLAWLPWAGRGGGAPSSRGRLTEAVAERLALVLPATSGVVTEAGLVVTTGLAVVALGAGVATGGGAGDDGPAREPVRRAATVASSATAAGAAPRATASPLAATGTTLVRSGQTLVRAGAATSAAADRARVAAEDEREEERARARRARERRAAALRRRRAAARAAATRAAAARASAAGSSTGAASSAGTGGSSAGATSGAGAGSSGSAAAPSGSGSSGGAASGGGGGAAQEFGFE